MGCAVVTVYMVALAIALFAGGVESLSSLLVFGLVALVGVVILAALGKCSRG